VLRTFAIITTNANQLMAHVHNRMPVIVEEADWPLWLGHTEGDPLLPAGEDVLRCVSAQWHVNSAGSNPRRASGGWRTPPTAPVHAAHTT
jgi:putative SOS response-associated peptidase YedK